MISTTEVQSNMMSQFAKQYYDQLIDFIHSIKATNQSGDDLDYYKAVEQVAQLAISQSKAGCKIMFIGNGASQAISSHLSTDFWKNGGMRAIAFTDPSVLTCISNDYGYKHVFEKPIEMFADKGDILVAISSSGQSENIIRAVQTARSKECKVITLSGFKKDNPLRLLGDFNFYISAQEYGPVEIIHHSICHCILDTILNSKPKNS